ncbi:30S ribosomal protein S20 [Jeotgalibaca dankookensis]|uniref:Small ribosomal subunit protein bS20 n=1 Tax=Jeotgalibaca dankookensis TaxID=708126 RepID=A0A1S6IN05_9LACT|nr:30S ribosomal protein S20 [Jeotgalibaca dankookensis]AQS52917.1 30S ribosomal protein S20 [Jeotgalibaca dankookensis]NLC93208.1 30S ribosomal protein S20 [Treponema sp.]
MPNIDSAIKRVRTSEKANLLNNNQKSAMRTKIKKYEAAVAEGAENSEALLLDAQKAIDSVASKGLIHANKAARDKSRLAKKLNK